jgi:hypothetical protein
MNLRRNIAIALLVMGTVAGYGSGIYRLTHKGSCSRDRATCERWHDDSVEKAER